MNNYTTPTKQFIMNTENKVIQNIIDISGKVGVIDGKMDLIIKHLEKINGRLGEHDNQISRLEIEHSRIRGATAGIAIAVSTVFAIVVYVTSYFIR